MTFLKSKCLKKDNSRNENLKKDNSGKINLKKDNSEQDKSERGQL